ncbi:MAG: S8 family serine peptidase [Thermoanaerobaculia bacterium]
MIPNAELQQRLAFPDVAQVGPVFSGNRLELQAKIEASSASFREKPVNDLVRYYQAYVPDDLSPRVWETLRQARSAGVIEWFDLQSAISAPATSLGSVLAAVGGCTSDLGPNGSTRPFEQCQGYLNVPDLISGRQQGVGARFAWTLRGGRGDTVTLVDLDTGWNLSHEEFQGREVTLFGPIVDHFHGTAVLGVLWGNPNDGVGVTGIVPETNIGLAPFNLSLPNPEGALDAVTASSGSVVLIEVQADRLTEPVGGVRLTLPIEAFDHGKAAINSAHEKGFYIVEVAGNGGLDLQEDLGIDPAGPALMVGAGHPATGRRVGVSNFGDRVDLQGWGQQVVTTGSRSGMGFDDLQRRNDTNACYTKSFDGTSSGAAIVAGCVAAISSILQNHKDDVDLPSSAELRSLLQSTGTFKNRAENGGIGSLPNLQLALKAIEEKIGGGFHFDPV